MHAKTETSPNYFISAKTAAAVPASHPLVRDALVQASLDPRVRAIDHVAPAHVDAPQVAVGAIIFDRADGRYVLDIVEARQKGFDAESAAGSVCACAGLLTLTAADVCADPLWSNARAVWAYRMLYVAITLRLGILGALEDGPTTLGALLERLRCDRDPAPAVMALACADLVGLDLASGPLGPSTIVRSRS